MAEYKEDGRHFSKRQVITYEDGEDFEVERLKIEKGIPEPNYTRAPQDIDKALGRFREKASQVLEAHGIPGSPLVYRCHRTFNWRPAWDVVATGGANPRRGAIITMEEHVRALGYARDSAPDLAARVLGGVHALEQADTHEEVVSAALWLGFDVAFAGGYQSESQKNAKRGATSKGAGYEWADLLAGHYLAKNSKMNGEEVYLKLKKDKPLRVDGWAISAGRNEKGGKAFKAKKSGDKKFRAITVDHFYKNYLLKAKKKT